MDQVQFQLSTELPLMNPQNFTNDGIIAQQRIIIGKCDWAVMQ